MSYDLVAKLRLIDNLSAPLRKATSGIDKAGQQATRAGGNFKHMGEAGKSALDKINISAGTLIKTFAAVEIARKSVEFVGDSLKKAMDFESEMSTIQALTGATKAQMADMQKLALDMGAKTKYSAMQAAQGIEELLKSGIDPATVKAGALEAALNLATAGGLELKDAAEIMSTSLNAFVKDGLKASEVANILAGTANASATDVGELKFALSMVGAVAGGIGMSFKDTNEALGVLANRALKGSDAGTSLKVMLQNLQPQTKQQIKMFDALGITTNGTANKFFTAKGKIQSFDKIAGVLHDSLKNMTDMQRQAALEVMFGTDAVRAASIIYDTGAQGVRDFAQEMTKVTALDVARQKMDNAVGAVEQFKGALETLQISGLMPVLPLLKDFANKAADFVSQNTPQITAAIQKMVDNAKTYMSTHFTNNPEFNRLTTLDAKIGFVIEDAMNAFNKWLDDGGRGMLTAMGTQAVNLIATSVEAATPGIVSAATKVGNALIESVGKGIINHPLFAAMAGAAAGGVIGGPLGALIGAVAGGGAAAIHRASPFVQGEDMSHNLGGQGGFLDQLNKGDPNKPMFPGGGTVSAPSHAGGLSRVPYNGYPAILHKDEMVLDKSNSDSYRSNRGGNGPIIGKIADTIVIREDADIDRIANAIALQLNAGY